MKFRTKIYILVLLLFNLTGLLLINVSFPYSLLYKSTMLTLVVVDLFSLLLVFGKYNDKEELNKYEKQDS